MRKIWPRMAAATLSLLLLNSCLEQKVKVLGKNGISLESDDTANAESFKFNFAYLDTSQAGVLAKTVTLQGSLNNRSAIIATCNSAGTSCVCEFLDAAGTELEESTTANIAYDTTGNYLRCTYTGATTPSKVRLRNISSSKISTTLDIKVPTAGASQLTLQEMFADLDVNSVRTVYRYECLFNFLHKQGTTSGAHNCDAAAVDCVAGNDFCLLQARYPFYLFQDNLQSNFPQKIADQLYNAGGSDRICNRQLKRIDCSDNTGTNGFNGVPATDFGLYNSQVGVYQVALGLSAGPGIANSTYGFAAEIDTYQTLPVCPPGLTPKKVYEATPLPATMQVGGGTDAVNDNNIPNGFTAYNIDESAGASTVAALTFKLMAGNSGGATNCDGVSCAVPSITVNASAYSFAYTASTTVTNTLCVIDKRLIP